MNDDDYQTRFNISFQPDWCRLLPYQSKTLRCSWWSLSLDKPTSRFNNKEIGLPIPYLLLILL